MFYVTNYCKTETAHSDVASSYSYGNFVGNNMNNAFGRQRVLNVWNNGKTKTKRISIQYIISDKSMTCSAALCADRECSLSHAMKLA